MNNFFLKVFKIQWLELNGNYQICILLIRGTDIKSSLFTMTTQ